MSVRPQKHELSVTGESVRSVSIEEMAALGASLFDRGMFVQAETILRHVVDRSDDDASSLNRLGLARAAQDDFEEAARFARFAAQRAPRKAEFQANLAAHLTELGRFEEAVDACRAGLRQVPEDPIVNERLGRLFLLQGRFEEGWPYYRKHKKPFSFEGGVVKFWTGEAVSGKRLVVLRAQGLVEEILSARLYRQLCEKCDRVTLVCDARLIPLYQRSFPGLKLIAGSEAEAIGAALGEADFAAYVTDLPALLAPDMKLFNQEAGYLKPDSEQVKALREKYKRAYPGKHLIGVSRRALSKLGAHGRSTALPDRLKLWGRADCQFIWLHDGSPAPEFHTMQRELGVKIVSDESVDATSSIDDLAAQICALDQVILTDDSTAHLAGALGKPVWALIPKFHHWFWGMEGETVPWYPTIRLFRQDSNSDWGSAVQDVKAALEQKSKRRVAMVPYRGRLRKNKSRSDSVPAEQLMARCHEKFTARDYDGALGILSKLGAQFPGHRVHARWNALCFYRKNLLHEAQDWSEKALKADPNEVENYRTAGVILQGLGDFEGAERALRKGIELDSTRGDLYSTLVMQKLLLGDYDEGWALYDKVSKAFTATRLNSGRQWLGEQLNKEKLHLWPLEGVGDFLLLMLLLPEIERRAQHIVIETDERLIPLIKRTGTRAKIRKLRDRKEGVLLPSLGPVHTAEFAGLRHLVPNLSLQRVATRSLKPDPAKVSALRKKYQRQFPGRLTVGLSWYSASTSQGIARSVPPEALKELLGISDCQFFDLQYQNPDCPMRDYHLPPGSLYRDEAIDSWGDLDGLAAQLSALDLTICIDNSTAQIAGAVGADCWTLLHTLPDWRWGLTGQSCEWYPDMRLFRQTALNDWSSVLDDVCRSLRKRLADRAIAVAS